jgi:hypothetical protein
MLNNNHKSCQFAEQTISYLYGEAEASDRVKFEAHLADCSQCADELAGFGFVRSAVLDWRNEDFVKLQTPSFNIPALESKNPFVTANSLTESRSWFGGFGKIFAFNPILSASLAVLVVCCGAALLTLDFSGGEIARSENSAKLAQPAAVSPKVEASKKVETTIIADEDSKNIADKNSKKSLPPDVKAADSSKQVKVEKQIMPVKSAVKVSYGSPKIDAGSSARNLKDASDNIKNIKKPASVRKQQVPNLNVADDDEDETLRLADLFDEIDAK